MILVPLATKVILLHAQVLTMNPAQPRATIVGVVDGKVAYVGDELPAAKKAVGGEPDSIIDCGGHTLMPGLNDAHVHFGLQLTLGSEHGVTLPDGAGQSRAGFRRAVLDAVIGQPGDHLLYILTRDLPIGINHATDLDFVTRPLFVVSSHGGLFNSAGFKLSGLGPEEAPNGFVRGRELAVALDRLAKAQSLGQLLAGARAFLRRCAALGLTSVQLIDDFPDLFESLRRRGELSLRVRFTPLGFRFDTRLYQPTWTAPAPEWVRLEGVKYFHDDGARLSRLELRSIFDVHVPIGRQVLIHVLSRRALVSLLDTLEALVRALPEGARARASRLFRLEHVDELGPGDAERLARLGIPVCSNPSMLPEWRHSLRDRAFPLRTLIDAKVRVCIGSDFVGVHTPVRPLDPWFAIGEAVNRTGPERITVEEALGAYTAGSADAEGLLAEKGTLVAGKWADLVVVSTDPLSVAPTELHRTTTLLTMVGGKIVFRSPELRDIPAHPGPSIGPAPSSLPSIGPERPTRRL